MENKNSFNIGSIAEKVTNGIKTAQKEIEDLALQFSLGKAEAGEKFEEIKKEFLNRINEWKNVFANIPEINTESKNKLIAKFEELQLQLALGKAESKVFYAEQRNKVLLAIHEIEAEIRTNPGLNGYMDEFKSELEKFKLKMDVLRLKFELKSFQVKDEFKNEVTHARIQIDKIFENIKTKKDDAKRKYADFGDEIELAYKHIKKAVDKL